jgi:general nucleoside transport system permease protein
LTWKLGALIAGAVVVVLLGLAAVEASPGLALKGLYDGSIGSAIDITATLKEMMPLLLAGLAVFVALRAGLFNIGVEGQLIVGGLCCAQVALYVPGVAGVAVGCLAGILGGAFWALPAGLIKAYRSGHEVITTIMLNRVADIFTLALVNGPLRAPGAQSAMTAELPASTSIGTLFKVGRFEINASLLIAFICIVAVAIWLKKTVSGFQFQAVGANPQAATIAGISAPRVTVAAMSASGALAGLTGALVVLAYQRQFSGALSASYGFTALGVALLAGAAPSALLLSAFVFAALNQGALNLQDEVPKGLIGVIVGLLLIIFAAIRYRRVPARA